MGRGLLWTLFVLIYVIAGIHLIAHVLYLYWTYWWLDIIVHFLTGAWCALFVVWAVCYSPYRARFARVANISRFVFAPGATALIALVWEAYQVVTHLTLAIPFKPNHLADSTLDVLASVAGAVLAVSCYEYLRTQSETLAHESPKQHKPQ